MANELENDPEAINDALFGLTYLQSLRFSCDSEGICYLELSLSKDLDGARAARLYVEGVSGLKAHGLGGGFTQLCGLQIKDVSDEQHDRIRYEVADLENDSLRLRGLAVRLALTT